MFVLLEEMNLKGRNKMIKNNGLEKIMESFFGSQMKGGFVEPYTYPTLSSDQVSETLIPYIFMNCKSKEDIEKAKANLISKINAFAEKEIDKIKKSSIDTYIIAKAYLFLHNRFVNMGNTSEYSLYDFAHNFINRIVGEGKIKDLSPKKVIESILTYVDNGGVLIKVEKVGKMSCDFVIANVIPNITSENARWANDFISSYENSL